MAELQRIDTTELYGAEPFRAAVSILLLDGKDGPELLFERRSTRIPDQPGDICFPGGAMEPGESPLEAARREAVEELCIAPEQLEYFGELTPFQTMRAVLYPFVGHLRSYRGSFSPEESEEVFTVPLSFFRQTEPECYPMPWDIRLIEDFPYERIVGGRNYRWLKRIDDVYFWEYEGRTIWGLTAKLLRAWLLTQPETLWKKK